MYKTYVDVKNGFAIEGNNSRTEVELGLLLTKEEGQKDKQ
jgi:hypothetical protein